MFLGLLDITEDGAGNTNLVGRIIAAAMQILFDLRNFELQGIR